MADNGQKILIKRGSKQSYVLTPISTDDLYFTSEMIARIKESQQEIRDGKSIVIKTKEELNTFFESL
jgi:ERCC4-type nuclease